MLWRFVTFLNFFFVWHFVMFLGFFFCLVKFSKPKFIVLGTIFFSWLFILFLNARLNIWSFFLYIILMIRSARPMIGNCLIVFLRGRGETESTWIGDSYSKSSWKTGLVISSLLFVKKYQLKRRVSSNNK